MFRILQSNNEYRNLELTETEFLHLVSGAVSELGVAVWNPDTHQYVNNLTADQVPSAYVSYSKVNFP